MSIIEIKNLKFAYEENSSRYILNDVTFNIEKGEVTGIIGLSGCGKSTLCQIIAGIIPNCIFGEISGEVIVDSIDISEVALSELAQEVGFVMQDPDRQIITQTVEDELAFGAENLCVPPKEIRERVDSVMELLGISHMAEMDPSNLSGGEKQLVAIGSVLTMKPKIIILDEPFSHLDEEGKDLIRKTIDSLSKKGKTIIVVDHDYKTAGIFNKMLWLEEGKISEHKG